MHHLIIRDHALGQSAFPVHQQRHVQPALIRCRLASPERSIVAGKSATSCAVFHGAASVVTDEDDERVFGDAQLIQQVDQSADVVIHVFENGDVVAAQETDTPVKSLVHPGLGRGGRLRFIDAKRTVHGVVGEVTEERGILGGVLSNELFGPPGEQLGRVPFGGAIGFAIVQDL